MRAQYRKMFPAHETDFDSKTWSGVHIRPRRRCCGPACIMLIEYNAARDLHVAQRTVHKSSNVDDVENSILEVRFYVDITYCSLCVGRLRTSYI